MSRGTGPGASGFTLLEVVIVLGILAVILGILAPMAFQLLVAERATAVEDELQAIYTAIVGNPGNGIFGYVGDVGKYPATLLDLVAAPKDSAGNPLPGWKGPYLQNPRIENSLHIDPLARPYEYFLVPVTSGVGNKLAIISRGLDGLSTNTAANPNLAANYAGPAPTDSAYVSDPQNADNVVFPKPTNATALDKIISGDVALNILNFDNNPKVNAFVPACPQLFSITATSVTRGTDDIANLTYAQGLTVDLVQGQYRVKISPQAQTTVSWTETMTVLPASTLARTLNLTGLDSSGTQQFNLTVVNKFATTEVEIFEFDSELTGAAVGSTMFNKGSLAAGVTQIYQPHACAQIYIKQKGPSSSTSPVLDQFVMPYGKFTRVIGATAASLTVVNMIEKRLKIFRNDVLVGTVPRGDVHDDEGQSHGHIKTKTFTDFMQFDVITIFSDNKDHTSTLLATVTLQAGNNTVTLQ